MPSKDTFPKAANWIWLDNFDDAAAAGQFVLFRKTFHLDAIPDGPVAVRVSADTRYRLFVNGHSASFGPCKSYLEHWHYETIQDVRPLLHVGQNVLAARVLRFSSTHPGCMSMIRSALPGFILACIFEGSDFEDILTDRSWKAQKDESVQLVDENEWDFRLGPQFLGLNENVDGRVAALEWNMPSFNDSDWSTAVVKTARRKMSPLLHPHRLAPREIPAMTEDFARFDGVTKQTGSVSNSDWARLLTAGVPVVLPANSTNVVDIQANAHMTAFVDVACTFDGPGSQSPTIQLQYSESYETPMIEGQQRHKSNRSDHANGELYGPSDTYIPHGRGDNHYSPFWWRTFRYIRLTVSTRGHPLTLTALTYRATHYPLQVTTTITTPPMSSTLLTDLWTISLHTLRNCMHETYEDGPYYEQSQFAMDARSQMLFTYLVARDDRLARKGLRELHASRCLDDDGLVSTHFPSAGRAIRIPTFSLFWVMMVHDHMVYWGDELLVRQYLGAADGILQYFEERCEDGLVGQFDDGDSGETWAFVDWVDGWMTPGHGFTGMAVPPAYYSHGAATIHSLLYAYTLLKAAELCAFVGRHDTAMEYRERHRVVVAAVRRRCYDSATGFFLDGPGALDQRSQHVQVFAVLAGCISNETVTASDLITKSLLEPKEHGLAQATIAMGFYVFRAASQAGVYDECWPTLIQPWQQMMDQNLTTWAESELPGARSDCHGWGATPLHEIVTEILGVECRSAAYLERVLGEKEGSLSQIRVAPRRALVEEISSTVAVGGGVSTGKEVETISVGWKVGEEVVLSASKGGQVVQVKVDESAAWEARTL